MMTPSPYYPPRAGPWSRFRVRTERVSRRLQDRLSRFVSPAFHLPTPFPRGLPWLFVPGLLWRQQGRTKLGNSVMAAWAALVLLHVATLDPSVAGTAALLASVLHGISAAAALATLCPHWQGLSGVLRTALTASALVFVLYSLGLRNMLSPWAQRVTVQGNSVMLHRANDFSDTPWKLGEWVSYRLPMGLVNLDRILAGPGDTLRFHDDSFEVNGRHFKKTSPHMPDSGEWLIAPRTYFIWPTEASFVHGAEEMTELLLPLTEIDESEILGRPYRRWFWKSINLPPLEPLPLPRP